MASTKLSHSLTRKFLKALPLFVALLSGVAHAEDIIDAKRKTTTKGAFSEEAMRDMRTGQHLDGLTSSHYQVVEYSVFYFEGLGKDAIPPLMEYLKDNGDNDKKVSAVIYTFGRLGEKSSRAVPVIMHYLKSENIEIRKTTIAALGKIGKASEPAVPEIARYLESDDEWFRTLALRALKGIKTPQSLSIARQYEKKRTLDEKRKADEIMKNGKGDDAKPDAAATAAKVEVPAVAPAEMPGGAAKEVSKIPEPAAAASVPPVAAPVAEPVAVPAESK